MNAKFYEVGGAVRDKLMGITPKDVDFAVEAPSFDAMRQAIKDRKGEIFLETPQFFTIRAKVPGLGAADFVLCRKDGAYRDGRHPETVEIGTIQDDLARRDFTMNAIARDVVSNVILDPFNGADDIKAKVIRFVGKAEDRLEEDRLRAFRAVRFAVTKSFYLKPDALKAIQDIGPLMFHAISTERIREEVTKMFRADTLTSIGFLFMTAPNLGRTMINRNIWLKPTTETQ